MNDNVTDIDLDALDLPQLKDLRRRIDQQIADLTRRQREEALLAAKAAASERGFDLAELLGQGRTGRGRGEDKGSPRRRAHRAMPTRTIRRRLGAAAGAAQLG